MTLRGRVAVAAALGVLVVVSAVAVVLYLAYAASLRSRVDGALVDAAQQASRLTERVKQAAADKQIPPDFNAPITVGSTELQLFTGPVAVGEPTRFGPLTSQDVAVARGEGVGYFTDAAASGKTFRVYTSALPGTSQGSLVRASRALDADHGALTRAQLLLAGLSVAAAAAAYGLARLAAGRILRPLGDLTSAAERVTETGDLTARIALESRPDEVGRLSTAFDDMLGALHESMTAQQQLVGDASHELRTPLTSLMTNLELLDEGAGVSDPQAPSIVRAAREQARELDQLVTDLLELAHLREATPHREYTRLDLLVAQVVERHGERDGGAVVQADLHPCVVLVDPAAVERAVKNLLDNAVKWSAPGAPVLVRVKDGTVTVTDTGPGISREDLPHIFERFYRAPAARGMPGAGLGLAIVGQVAAAHEAVVDVVTADTGCTFSLAFTGSEPVAEDHVPG